MKSERKIIILMLIVLMGLGATVIWMQHKYVPTDTTSALPPQEYIQPDINTVDEFTEYTDGLGTPFETIQHQLDDMATGIAQTDIFKYDINGDGILDKITRTRNENGTAHFWDEYKIEINLNGNWIDITPDDFRTVEGAECALQKIQFQFVPQFQIVKISRPWQDSWVTPTQATRTVYKSGSNQIVKISETAADTVCDVTELFTK